MPGSITFKFSSPNGPFIADGINEGTRCSVVGIEFRPKGLNGYRVSYAGGIAASGEAPAIHLVPSYTYTYDMHLNGVYRDNCTFTFTEVDDTENK